MIDLVELKEKYDAMDAWGMSATIDLHGCNHDTIRDAEAVKRFVRELCDKIGMRRFGETVVVDFGDDPKVTGFSMTQLIETSLISGHFANNSDRVFLDVFSCAFYDPQATADFAKEFFGATDATLTVTLRK